MKRTGLSIAAILTTLGLTLTACGGGAPSKDELAESLVENGELTEELADCVAEELLDSDLNDDQLNAIADDEDDLDDEDEAEALAALTDAAGKCATE